MDGLTPRPYTGTVDLQKMRDLLVEGRKANKGTYYVHPGDLNWWLFYPPLEFDLWQYITLWDDPRHPDRLLGWALLSPTWGAFDVFVQPELLGSSVADAMHGYAEEQLTSLVHAQKKNRIFRMWVSEKDAVSCEYFLRAGFHRSKDDVVYMTRPLDAPIPLPALPEAWSVRPVLGEAEAAARAAAQYGAYDSQAPFEKYLQRYLNFMRSPVYDPALDIVAVLPDGQIGSFCILWTEPVNRVGLFEPVGTHPAFRGKGLAKGVMLEGLRRLRERGMQNAILCTSRDNLPAVRLYESVGFANTDTHLTFEKNI
jgi:ribosomal protein S18 acetylase RimI-like enzyme